MNDAQYAECLARLRAERVAKGQAPTIQSPYVYRLLEAVLASHAEKERKRQAAARPRKKN